MASGSVVLFGCGDVGPTHEPIEPYSALVRDTLASGDLRFGQVERVYSTRGTPQVHSARSHSRVKPELASVLTDCKFDVVSVASNHGLDWGSDALLDSVENVRNRGIIPIGAGSNLEEACKPAFIERNGVRIAFLAFCSVLSEGYAATKTLPGIAPLRAHTYYEAFESQPGMPPKVVTLPYEDDMRGMVEHIARAKKDAHCVVVSFHWGLHFIPKMIADYQRIAERAAFDAGADLILGHHAHLPKGIDVYKGKVCFFSLSNFIMTFEASPETATKFKQRYAAFGAEMDPDPAYRRMAYGSDGKRSLIAKAVLTKDGVQKVSFLPVLIDRQLRPEILRKGDPRFDDMVRYMDWASEDLNHKFAVEGDEVVIQG